MINEAQEQAAIYKTQKGSRAQMRRLGDVCQLNPKLPVNARPASNTEVSFVPMSAVDDEAGVMHAPEVRLYSEVAKGYTYFAEGDVLFAKITPCMENGKAAIATNLVNGIGFGSTEFHILRPMPDVLPEWIFYLIRQEPFRRQAKAQFTGSAGQQRVPRKFLEDAEVLIPPLIEQRRIVDILKRADGIRRLRKQAIQTASELIPALLVDMFGDPATNPKGWPVVTCGELIVDGPQNGLYKPSSDYGDGTPILRIDSFYDGAVSDWTSLRRLRISDQERAKYCLHEGNIVINRVNSPEYLGKSALITGLLEETVFESNMMRFSVDTNRILPTYLIRYLQTSYIKNQILSGAKHAINQSSINQQDVGSLRIILPPAALQQKFVELTQNVIGVEVQQETAATKSGSVFASLLHRAFRGDI